jgi:hypothetical protein
VCAEGVDESERVQGGRAEVVEDAAHFLDGVAYLGLGSVQDLPGSVRVAGQGTSDRFQAEGHPG